MKSLLTCLLLAALCIPAQAGGLRQHSRPRAKAAQGLLALLQPEDSLQYCVFSGSDYELQVLDEGDLQRPRYGSLPQALAQAGCSFGSNGGYFAADAQGSPLGLLLHNGKASGKLADKGFSVAGLLYDDGRLHLVRSSRLGGNGKGMREALQAGPFLLEGGKLIPGLNNKKEARRSFIATDGKGRFCLGVSSPLTLAALALWLREKGTLGDFKVETALNLDGGSSSAFYVDGLLRLQNYKAVRNYIGFRPRRAEHTQEGRRSKK